MRMNWLTTLCFASPSLPPLPQRLLNYLQYLQPAARALRLAEATALSKVPTSVSPAFNCVGGRLTECLSMSPLKSIDSRDPVAAVEHLPYQCLQGAPPCDLHIP